MSDAASPRPAQTGQHPPVSFSSFLVSLGHTAMEHLHSSDSKELELAREAIDLIGILQTKTQGNLDDEEARLLESMLGDLRQRYREQGGR